MLTERQEDIIIGMLMGDACVTNDTKHPRLRTGMVTEDFVDWLHDELSPISLGVKEGLVTDAGNQIYQFYTTPHPRLTKFREWYGADGKKYPVNLSLNSLRAKIWYACDGSLRWDHQNHSPHVRISVANESEREEFLQGLFENMNPTLSCGMLEFSPDDTSRFLSWTEPSVPGFKRKWEKDSYVEYRKMNEASNKVNTH